MIDRIQKILQIKKLSPSQFADEIQVQRSGVSHILSGRNKPSLDFILKVLTSYPEIDADWLLFGKGKMTSNNDEKIKQHIKSENFSQMKNQLHDVDDSSPQKIELKNNKRQSNPGKNKSIVKIVVFSSDNTFKEYFPED